MSMYEVALAEAWAMRPHALETLLAIADRTNDVTPEALEAFRAEHAAKGERLRFRDDVAIIDFTGPMFKKANLFQAMSGATSYSVIAQDFTEALNDNKYAGIIGLFDTPGGAVNGCDELGSLIFNARGKKPMVAVVSGQACSAGYWQACAFDRIVLSEASEVGSIGVILGLVDSKEADAKAGKRTVEFVSSKAPNKRPDYDTDDGRAVYQRRADNLGELFIATVAKYRGISVEKVTNDFGAGGVEIGENAVKLGMADEVGTFETVFAQLTKRGSRRSTKPQGASSMANENTDDKAFSQTEVNTQVSDAVAAALAAHKTRVAAITGSVEGKANGALADHLAQNTDLTAEAAIATLKAAGPAAKAAEPGGLTAAERFKQERLDGETLAFAEPTDQPSKNNGWGAIVATTNGKSAA